jgi:hypothetical protein
LVIRVSGGAADQPPRAEVHVHPESRSWFLYVGHGGHVYTAELGYYAKADRRWVKIAASGPTFTPPDSLSPDMTVQFATIPAEVPFAQLLRAVQGVVRSQGSLVQALEELRAAGYPDVPAAELFAEPPLTPAQEAALAKAIAMDEARRVWVGSLELTEVVRRQLLGQLSSAAAARLGRPGAGAGEARRGAPVALGPPGPLAGAAPPAFPGPAGGAGEFGPEAPGAPWGEITSFPGPVGEVARPGGFWFNVNAELIVYGATEPDAIVTLGGRRIKLRSDGSFSYRFALPDGQFELSTVARSAHGDEARSADLTFSRSTRYEGAVGAQPPEVELPLADPAHVV